MAKKNNRVAAPAPAVKKKSTTTLRTDSLILIIAAAVVVGFISGAAMAIYKSGGTGTRTAAVPPASSGSPSVSLPDMAQIDQLEKIAQQHPEVSAGWVALGNACFDANLFAKAIEAYEKAVKLDENQPGVWTDLGVMYRRTKQPRKAIEMFDKAIAVDPKHEISRFNKGVVLLHDLNDRKGALEAWQQLLAVNPVATTPDGQSLDALIEQMKSLPEKP